MCNCKSCHSKQLLKNDYIRILKSLLLNKNWSPKGLLLFQILVSFSLLKVTFDGLLDTFPPCFRYVRCQECHQRHPYPPSSVLDPWSTIDS